MIYNLYELRLGRDADPGELAAQIYGQSGGGMLGVFTPVLGYASNEALALTDERASPDAVLKGFGVAGVELHRMSPTLRPHQNAAPEPGGVYVHHWLEVDAERFEESVRAIGATWSSLEADGRAKVFGLFAVEPTVSERTAGSRRLLSMTRYPDLAAWEALQGLTGPLAGLSLARACRLADR